jgi:serine protease inhibitor
MKRLFNCLICLICLLLSLATCLTAGACARATSSASQTTEPTTTSAETTAPAIDIAVDLMASIKAAAWPEKPAVPNAAFQASVQTFAWNLMQKSAANPGNILISPASVYIALAMTANGSDTTTRQAMLTLLGSSGLDLTALNESTRNWQVRLAAASTKAECSIANSIWYRNGFEADPVFLQANADFYAAGARSLDFNKPEALATINGWVKKQTKGQIEKIIEKIDPAVVMYLINTLYFKSDFAVAFNPKITTAGQFQATDGSIKIDLMHRTESLPYLAGNKVEGVLLPFADARYAFMALLPAAGTTPRAVLSQMQATDFDTLLTSRQNSLIELTLPKFTANYSDSLVNELADLGLGIAFSDKADFSLMQTSRARNLFISDVMHKTTCDVNEKGVEAAAATAVEISKTGGDQPEHRLVFDRPFIYGIIEMETGLPLFIGLMENPAA